jgi:hypothetical protein
LHDLTICDDLFVAERRHGHRRVSAAASAGTWPCSPSSSLTPNPTLKASPCPHESIAAFTASRREPYWPPHCRQVATAAMAGDAPCRSNPSTAVANQWVRFVERNTVVWSASPETSPMARKRRPESLPCPALTVSGARLSGRISPLFGFGPRWADHHSGRTVAACLGY